MKFPLGYKVFRLGLLLVGACTVQGQAQVLSFEQAKQRADAGDAFAQAVVALHYQLGWNTDKNPELAARYAMASANAGHPLGKFRLGALLRAGEGVPKDEQQGLALQAASFNGLDRMTGDPYALTSLGVMIFQGKAVWQNVPQEKRRQQAAQLYKRAADAGFAPAEFNYAMALNDGHGVAKDAGAFKQYLRESLFAEYPPAQNFALKQAKALVQHEIDDGSSVEGVNSSGDRWAYEFVGLDSQTSKEHRLQNPNPEDIIFGSDKYIVTKRLVYLGVSRFSTTLFFYDARSLVLDAVVSVPNNVCSVEYSDKRQQFVLLTIGRNGEPGVKWPDDNGQSLVLVDLRSRTIERVAVWRKGTSFYEYGGPNLDPRWDGDEVVLNKAKFPPKGSTEYLNSLYMDGLYTKGDVKISEDDPRANYSFFIEDMQFRKPAFKDVVVSVGRPELPVLTANENKALIEIAGMQDQASKAKQSGSKKDVPSDDSPHFAISKHDAGAERMSMLLPSGTGKLTLVDLAALSSRVLIPPMGLIEGLGVFDDGGFYARSGPEVFVYSVDGAARMATVGHLTESSEASFCGKRLYFASYDDKRQPAFQISSIGSNGLLSDEVIGLGPDAKPDRYRQESEQSPKIYDFAMDAARNSVSILTTGDRSKTLAEGFGLPLAASDFDMGVWWESDWRSGKLLEAPYQDESARGMFGAAGRFYGQAPSGWSIVSQEASTTSGSENTVSLKQLGTANEIVVGTSPYALRGGKPLVALDVDDQAKLVISGGNRGVQLERVSLSGNNTAKLAQFSWDDSQGDRSFFVSGKNWLVVPQEGGSKILKIDTSKASCEALADVYFGGGEDYVILLPNGNYAGSPGCESLLRLTAGDGKVDGSSIAKWRNRPAEVLKALDGDPEQIEVLAKVTERWQKRIGFDDSQPEPKASDLPKVSVPERPPLWAESAEVQFPIDWQAGVLPLSRVIVRVNGVESARFEGDALPAAAAPKGSVEAKVTVAEGQNWIEVTAEDAEGRRSDMQRFRTILKDAPTETNRYIVALGVSDYAKSELDLQFAAKDANDLLEALAGSGVQGSDKVLLLTNEHVDRSAAEKVREFVGRSSESDEVILFCAGHGVLDDKLDYYFAGHDFDSDRPAETGIKLDDLVNAVSSAKALRRLILLDTCHAGVVGEKDEILLAQMDTKLPTGVRAVAQRGMKVQQAADFSASDKQRFIEEMFSLPGTIRGVNIIGASAGAQFALESDQWNNGVFTASVIEGLRDKKADWNQDGRITVSELKNYLGKRVSELTAGAQKPSVVAFEQDQDFDLLN